MEELFSDSSKMTKLMVLQHIRVFITNMLDSFHKIRLTGMEFRHGIMDWSIKESGKIILLMAGAGNKKLMGKVIMASGRKAIR